MVNDVFVSTHIPWNYFGPFLSKLLGGKKICQERKPRKEVEWPAFPLATLSLPSPTRAPSAALCCLSDRK